MCCVCVKTTRTPQFYGASGQEKAKEDALPLKCLACCVFVKKSTHRYQTSPRLESSLPASAPAPAHPQRLAWKLKTRCPGEYRFAHHVHRNETSRVCVDTHMNPNAISQGWINSNARMHDSNVMNASFLHATPRVLSTGSWLRSSFTVPIRVEAKVINYWSLYTSLCFDFV